MIQSPRVERMACRHAKVGASALLLALTACSPNDSGSSDPLLLEVVNLDLEYEAVTPSLQDDRYWASFVVVLANGTSDTLPLAFPLFSVASNSGLAYMASEATVLERNACALDTSVLPNASASCRVLFSLRKGELPASITYTMDKHSASTDVEICPRSAAPDLCGRRCVDLMSDPDNCGGCGETVPQGFECQSGVPACPETTFLCGESCVPRGGTLANCSGSCVDLATDRDHCGACGVSLSPDEHCVDGKPACTTLTQCGNRCIDTRTDVDHCGGCDEACPAVPPEVGAEQSCHAATCHIRFLTPGGQCQTLCSQLGRTCYNPAMDQSCSCAVDYPAGGCYCNCVE